MIDIILNKSRAIHVSFYIYHVISKHVTKITFFISSRTARKVMKYFNICGVSLNTQKRAQKFMRINRCVYVNIYTE